MKVFKCDYRRIDKKGNLVMYNAEVIGEVTHKDELHKLYYTYRTDQWMKGKFTKYMLCPDLSYPGKTIILRESVRYKNHSPSLYS